MNDVYLFLPSPIFIPSMYIYRGTLAELSAVYFIFGILYFIHRRSLYRLLGCTLHRHRNRYIKIWCQEIRLHKILTNTLYIYTYIYNFILNFII